MENIVTMLKEEYIKEFAKAESYFICVALGSIHHKITSEDYLYLRNRIDNAVERTGSISILKLPYELEDYMADSDVLFAFRLGFLTEWEKQYEAQAPFLRTQ